MSAAAPRSTWSNRWAFILVTIGSAVGLGNIWRFPYMTGAQGGSAFVLVYLLCVALVGLPLLMAEILIGRRGGGNPVSAMLKVAEENGASPWWGLLGWIGVLGALLILSFYSVVGGWVVDYMYQAGSGVAVATPEAAKQGFDALLADPLRLVFWHTVFLALTVGVVARGVISGIERASLLMMPALFAILLFLVLWGGMVGDLRAAWHFMFDFKPEQLTGQVVLSAMGHAFFSLSLGMGAVMAYGSYLDKQSSIARNSFWIALADTLVGLLAGLAIFSLTFAHGLEAGSGPGLIFQTLPLVFTHMPGGRVVGTLFFLLVLFAAWTSAISLVEPFVAWVTERLGVHRAIAAWGTGFAVWLLGVAVCLSFNDWSGWKLFGLNLFDQLDYLTSRVIMPLSGLAIALFVGWIMRQKNVRDEISLPVAPFQLWWRVLRYLTILAIVLVFVYRLLNPDP
ncbi:MAG: sodium-dependent transporter [Zoogloeaceae bacterium]|jgi:NSS family neurotransmitter:Na+ symporter|nr:sodium-dependent transporter [Zoogloeaceae bacterium]